MFEEVFFVSQLHKCFSRFFKRKQQCWEHYDFHESESECESLGHESKSESESIKAEIYESECESESTCYESESECESDSVNSSPVKFSP